MDLLQGHYTTSVSRDMAVPRKGGLLENYAVGTIRYSLNSLYITKLSHFELLMGIPSKSFTFCMFSVCILTKHMYIHNLSTLTWYSLFTGNSWINYWNVFLIYSNRTKLMHIFLYSPSALLLHWLWEL